MRKEPEIWGGFFDVMMNLSRILPTFYNGNGRKTDLPPSPFQFCS